MNTKRILCLILSILMLLSLTLPMSVFAEDFYEEEFYGEPLEEEYIDEQLPEEDYFEGEYIDEQLPEENYFEEEYIDEQLPKENYVQDGFIEESVYVEDEVAAEDSGSMEATQKETFVVSDSEIFNTTELTITKQPVDVEDGGIGKESTISIEATGDGISYQWYYKKTSSSRFVVWNNSNKAELTFTSNSSYENMLVYCVVTDANSNTVQSDTVTVKFAKTFTVDNITYKILENENNVEVSSYIGEGTELFIPTDVTFDGQTYLVKAIGKEAFMGNTALTKITLPNSIEIIKEKAFKGCSNLSQMTCY